MSYTLGPRQTARFKDLATIFRPRTNATSSEVYDTIATNVKCGFVPTDNFDEISGGVGQKQLNIMTSDRINFHSAEDIQDDDVIHVQSGSVHEPDTWKIVAGAPKSLSQHAMSQIVYVAPFRPLLSGQILS